MEGVPPSETTDPWERFCQDTEMTDNPVRKGVVYKNVIGTYLHGPLLPKNPQLADLLISRALEKKYGKKIELEKLDDSEEQEANSYIFHRFVKNEG